MSEQMQNAQQDRAMAYLALQLGKMGGKAVGEPPSDEELAALSEHALGDVRYAQVLSHIASNSRVYQRWMQIGESIAQLQDKEAATKRVGATGDSLIQRLGNWLFNSKQGMGVFGGGLATAAVLVLAVFLVPSMQDPNSLEQQFQYWKPYIGENWVQTEVSPKYQKPASDSRAFFIKSEYQKVFAYGFQKGAGELGMARYEQLGIVFKKAAKTPPVASRNVQQEQYKALLDLGRLTALTTLQCEMNIQADKFQPLYHSAALLSAKLYTIRDEKISRWARTLERQSSSSAQMQALCRFSGDAVKQLL